MNAKITRLEPFGVIIEPKASGDDVRDLDVAKLKEYFDRDQLVVLRGFRTFETAPEFSDFCERWGEISLWPFGKVLELVEHDDPQDHIFDSNYVPLHWDGMYRPQVPEFQIFHCVKAPLSGKGGRTTFSHTALCLRNAGPDVRAVWNDVTGVYQRKMEFYDSKTVSPIVTKHPRKDYHVTRYNEPPAKNDEGFLNHPGLEFLGAGDVEELHRSLRQALYAPANFYAHEWHTGDVVIADNFTLLHGREAFESKSPRHLRRVHVLSDPPLNNPGLMVYQ
jgi:alpha-ketoglutarate-dependent taurine dioxygenase